jgi:hypothetical protein
VYKEEVVEMSLGVDDKILEFIASKAFLEYQISKVDDSEFM